MFQAALLSTSGVIFILAGPLHTKELGLIAYADNVSVMLRKGKHKKDVPMKYLVSEDKRTTFLNVACALGDLLKFHFYFHFLCEKGRRNELKRV
jgi:hypothetical protein